MKNEIVVPILNDEYKVIVCWGDPVQIKKVLKDWYYPEDDITSSLLNRRGVCYYNPECHPVIALPDMPHNFEEIGTLAHEAVHAVEDIFRKIAEPPSGELFAHSVGAIVRTVLKKNTPRPKSIKK